MRSKLAWTTRVETQEERNAHVRLRQLGALEGSGRCPPSRSDARHRSPSSKRVPVTEQTKRATGITTVSDLTNPSVDGLFAALRPHVLTTSTHRNRRYKINVAGALVTRRGTKVDLACTIHKSGARYMDNLNNEVKGEPPARARRIVVCRPACPSA